MLFADGATWQALLSEIAALYHGEINNVLDLNGQGGDLGRLLAANGKKVLAVVPAASVNAMRRGAGRDGLADNCLFVPDDAKLWRYIPDASLDLMVMPNSAINLQSDAKALGRLAARAARALRPGGFVVWDFLTRQGLAACYGDEIRLAVADGHYLQIDHGRYTAEERTAKVQRRFFWARDACWQEEAREVPLYGFSVAQYRCAFGGADYALLSQSVWPELGQIEAKVRLENAHHILSVVRRTAG